MGGSEGVADVFEFAHGGEAIGFVVFVQGVEAQEEDIGGEEVALFGEGYELGEALAPVLFDGDRFAGQGESLPAGGQDGAVGRLELPTGVGAEPPAALAFFMVRGEELKRGGAPDGDAEGVECADGFALGGEIGAEGFEQCGDFREERGGAGMVDPAVLEALLQGERVGTLFHPSAEPLSDRKRWLAHALLPSGSLRVDAGAEQALLHRGASLLAVGILAVEGDFARHQPVRVLASDGRELARGLVRLSSAEILAILGLPSEAVRQRLGAVGDAVIHRDQLVLTPQVPSPAGAAGGGGERADGPTAPSAAVEQGSGPTISR